MRAARASRCSCILECFLSGMDRVRLEVLTVRPWASWVVEGRKVLLQARITPSPVMVESWWSWMMGARASSGDVALIQSSE